MANLRIKIGKKWIKIGEKSDELTQLWEEFAEFGESTGFTKQFVDHAWGCWGLGETIKFAVSLRPLTEPKIVEKVKKTFQDYLLAQHNIEADLTFQIFLYSDGQMKEVQHGTTN
jgi:hypothetical protein